MIGLAVLQCQQSYNLLIMSKYMYLTKYVVCVVAFSVEKPPRFRQNENAQKRPPRDDNRDLQRPETDFR